MKTPVTITFVVCGTGLLLAPMAFDQIQWHSYATALQSNAPAGTILDMKVAASAPIRIFLNIAGGTMVAFGAYNSMSDKSMPDD